MQGFFYKIVFAYKTPWLHTCAIVILAIVLGKMVDKIPFPLNLTLFIILFGGLFFVVSPKKFFWLLPVAILGPPLPLIKGLTIPQIIIPGMFFSVILITMLEKRKSLFKYIPLVVYVYFLIAFVHYLKNPTIPGHIFDPKAPYGTFRMYWSFFGQFMIYAIVPYFFSNEKRQVLLIKTIVVLSVVIILFYMFMIFQKPGFIGKELLGFSYSWDIHYLSSPGSLPVRVGPLSVLGLLLFQIVLVFGQNSKKKIWRGLLIVLSVCAVVLSGGRAALLTMVVSFILFFILTRKYKELVVATLAGISIISMLLVGSSHLGDRVPAQFQRFLAILPGESRVGEFGEQAAGSSLWRLQLWQLGWNEVRKHPFIGTGYQVITKRDEDHPVGDTKSMHKKALKAGGLHNAYLANLMILGSLGLFLFLVILLSHTYKAFKIFRYADDPFIRQLHLWLVIVAASTMIRVWFEGGTTSLWLFFVLGLINASFKLSKVRAS